jgi:hypothetical protein
VESVRREPLLEAVLRDRIVDELRGVDALAHALLVTQTLHLVDGKRLVLPPVHQKVLLAGDAVNAVVPDEGQREDGEDGAAPAADGAVVDAHVHEVGRDGGVDDGDENGDRAVRAAPCALRVVGLAVGDLEDALDELRRGHLLLEHPVELAEVGLELAIGLEGRERTVPVHTDVTETGKRVECGGNRHVEECFFLSVFTFQ